MRANTEVGKSDTSSDHRTRSHVLDFTVLNLTDLFNSGHQHTDSPSTSILRCLLWRMMGILLTLLFFLHSLSWPVLSLLYPLRETAMAIEGESKLDGDQWLAYWIFYSLLTLVEMLLQPVLELMPIWYDVKLLFVAWLVLPTFRGATLLYERFVREQIKKTGWFGEDHDN